MVEIQKFLLDDGSEVFIEVEPVALSGGMELVAREGEAATISSTLARIKPTVDAVLATMRDVKVAPNEVELAFGVKFSAGVGAIFAKAATDANFSVKLKWSGGSGGGG